MLMQPPGRVLKLFYVQFKNSPNKLKRNFACFSVKSPVIFNAAAVVTADSCAAHVLVNVADETGWTLEM